MQSYVPKINRNINISNINEYDLETGNWHFQEMWVYALENCIETIFYLTVVVYYFVWANTDIKTCLFIATEL